MLQHSTQLILSRGLTITHFNKMIIDRLENKRYEKNINLYKSAAVITLILAIFKVIYTPNIFTGFAKPVDFITSLIPIVIFIQFKRTAKKWGGQFIEWRENEVEFKSRKYDKIIVHYNNITSINIKLDIIKIETEQKKVEINIEDYTEYEDRIRLKSNFEKIKNEIVTVSK
jgi:hypothetical protein